MDSNRIKNFLGQPGYGPAPESDKAVQEWLDLHKRKFGHFVNGAWKVSNPNRYRPILCPATKTVLAEVADGMPEDVDAAVEAARAEFPSWSATSGHDRAKYLYAIARCLQKNARLFAVLESLNNGKTIRETRDIDIPLAIRHFYYYAGWAKRHTHEFPDMEPSGVVAQIIPWNFPLLMLAWKIAPAIAVGNTVVLKPAEFTPLTALMFAEMLKEEVRLPAGVVNIVCGAGETGEYLVNHPVPWKVAFTGSTEVGRKICLATAGTGKRLTMELGGKSPLIVFADADLDSAIEGVVNAIWFNQGQVCCAGSRLLVEESAYGKFVARLKERMKKLRAGHSLDKAVDIGAINSQAQLEKIRRLVEIGKEEGAVFWSPENFACDLPGYYFPPTIAENVSPTATIAQEEIFGPVLVCMSFRTPKEAVDLANNTRYGLAASVWSQDINQAFDVAKKLKAGTVWINDTNKFDAASGFGGYRESGWGREGGSEGIREYLKERKATAAFCAREFDQKNYIQLQNQHPEIDRTYRLFYNGKLNRPDGEVSFSVRSATGELLGTLADANRKDVRNAVEAARGAVNSWSESDADLRGKILFFLAENLEAQKERFAETIAREMRCSIKSGRNEVNLAIERLFDYASLVDKFEGKVHPVPGKMLVNALKEPIGVIGIKVPDELPLLGVVATMAPAIAMGNTIVLVAGNHPLTAMEFVQVLQNSDIPPGVVNILSTAKPDSTAEQSVLWTLAAHEDVDAMWYFGIKAGSRLVEELSAISNLKQTWVSHGEPIDWFSNGNSQIYRCLYKATQVKNIWSPYGV